jgi:stage II sporulation protein D
MPSPLPRRNAPRLPLRIAGRGAPALLALALLSPAGAARAPLSYPEAAPSLYDEIDPGLKLSEPRVRIGLSADRQQVRLGATGRYRLLELPGGGTVWRDLFRKDLVIVPLAGTPTGDRYRYSVQVASFAGREAAEELAAELSSRFGEAARAVHHPDRDTWRVRIGRARSREALSQLAARLGKAGYDEVWIAEEPVEGTTAGGLRLVDDQYVDFPVESSRLVAVPVGRSRLKVNGSAYRGLVEIRLDSGGGLRVINELPLEEYLRGVVPEELGPRVWPELEALKAQAVAARTYTLGNLGQFAQEGFDLCDTARCQVYGGADSEHETTDRAVVETAGEVLAFEGRPIRALYTSTCGGHTEDGDKVFENETGPWLRGVPCRPESEALETSRLRITGRRPGPPGTAETGDPTPLALARLVVRGIVPEEALDGEWRARPAEGPEVRSWIAALARQVGKAPPPEVSGLPSGTLREAVELLVLSLGWKERAVGRFAEHDAAIALRAPDLEELSPEWRPAWAYAVDEGVLVPFDDGTLRPEHRPSRALVLGLLGRALALYGEGEERRVSFLEGTSKALVVRSRSQDRKLRLAGEPILLVEDGGGTRQVPWLDFYPGDRLRVHRDRADRVDLVVSHERKGPTDDRHSVKYRWEVSYSAEELNRLVARRVPAGRLRDLQVVERGVSGRVAVLRLVGSRGRYTVRGFRIRSVLGLEETLFTVDLQRAPDGSISRATFTGRGWGHGVGLCQVGAYGMALRGEGYRDILHHYYTGVDLVKAY